MQPFKIRVAALAPVDQRGRLERTRWPDETSGSDWDYGTNQGYLRELVEDIRAFCRPLRQQ